MSDREREERMTLDHDPTPPFEVVDSTEVGRQWNVSLRRDRVRWPDGTEADYRVVEDPDTVFVVAHSQGCYTVLERKWRHPRAVTAWDVELKAPEFARRSRCRETSPPLSLNPGLSAVLKI